MTAAPPPAVDRRAVEAFALAAWLSSAPSLTSRTGGCAGGQLCGSTRLGGRARRR